MEEKHPLLRPWIARVFVGCFMLLLAFIGLILTDAKAGFAWTYWRYVAIIFALLALLLSWYLRHRHESFSAVLIWYEILHWLGLIGSVYLVTLFVTIGIISPFIAALIVLTLISQSVFLAGIYIDSSFLLTGVVLGLFAVAIAWLEEYLYALIIPLLLVAGGGIALLAWLTHKKKTP